MTPSNDSAVPLQQVVEDLHHARPADKDGIYVWDVECGYLKPNVEAERHL